MSASRVPIATHHFLCALHALPTLLFLLPTRPAPFPLLLLSFPCYRLHFHSPSIYLTFFFVISSPSFILRSDRRGDSGKEFRSYRAKMGSKTPAMLADEVNSAVNASNKRTVKGKAPRRINKAVREKLKREHLNELFLNLARALELDESNNGKASILCETTRFLKDMFGQIESLRKENTSLLSESHYVSVEKNELKEEKSVLENQISELQTEIEARVKRSKPDLNGSPVPEFHIQQPELAPQFPGLAAFQEASGLQQQPSTPTTLLVLPMQPNVQTYHISDAPQKHISNVSKPHPRYPSAADSWPAQLLEDVRAGRKSSYGR